MKTQINRTRVVPLAVCLGLGLLAQASYAQDQTSMAPPVSDGGAPAAGQNVYNWHDVPVNQQVQITRAVFDQGGYQLYASTGETIVVPFVNQNLYAMKFGQTSGGMYFVNDGNAPTLFVPPGGYLENAAASGAHWYPFPHNFAYSSPVYIGLAPSWNDYESMGWYPGMVYYGGYWGYHPWHTGLAFSPFPGLYFSIGGHPYYGWNSYHSYYYGHPYNRVYERSYTPYHYYGVARRGPAYFSNHTNVFVHNNYSHTTVVHNSFGHQTGSFGHTTTAIHGGSFGNSAPTRAFGTNHAFGGAVSHPGGSFGHTTTGAFGSHSAGAFGSHPAGSFGHGPSGFGTGRAAGGSFGHSAPTGGSFGHSAPTGGSFGHSAPSGGGFGHSAPAGGGSFGHSGGGAAPAAGASHGSFGGGGGGGGSHGSFGHH